MKHTFLAVLLFLAAGFSFGQAVNAPSTFPATEYANNPSVVVNYNDAATSFKDQVSGSMFIQSATAQFGTIPATLGSQVSATVAVIPTPLPTGTLNQLSVQFGTAPVAGSLLTIVILSGTLPSLTIVSSFTVTVAATTAVQTFTAPTNFTAVATTAGQYLGDWVAPSQGTVQPGCSTPAPLGTYYLSSQSTLPTGAQSYTFYNGCTPSVSALITVSSPGTITTRQAGFDNTNNSNYSAGFTYNAWNAAPNNTLGAVEWNAPFSILKHIDRFNWNRTGTLVLASKGDIGSHGNNYWELYVQMSGSSSQLCFARNGFGASPTAGSPGYVLQSRCTSSSQDIMPNGFNYDILYTEDGTGSSPGMTLYLNGLVVASYAGTSGVGFGSATVNATGGTGYAASTPFIGVGGGTGCTITGNMISSGGVPLTTNGFTFTNNYGCTSVPSITFNFSVPSALSIGNTCAVQLPASATSVSCSLTGVTAGSAIILGSLPNNTTGVTDSAGTPVLFATPPSGQGPIYYVANASAGTHTFTYTVAAPNTVYYYPSAFEIKGAAASSPIDTAAYATGTGTAVSVGPITTTGASEFALAFMQTISFGGSGWTMPTGGFTMPTGANTNNYAYRQATTIGSYTFGVTQAASAGWQAQLVAIKPSITTYAPTGTGVSLSYGLTGFAMNSTTYPVMAPGQISGGSPLGVAGTNSAAPVTYDDEFAIFPSVLSPTAVGQLFYQTKFYQGVVNAANPKPVLIVDNDTFGDSDNEFMYQMAIGLHKAGLATLAGVVVEEYNAVCVAAWRQMLDAAGLNDVPLTVPPVNPGNNEGCPTAAVASYNASTPTTIGAYATSTAMYRTIFAEYPTRPIDVLLGAANWGAFAAFMMSGADSISPLTGLQLVAQNGANGGAAYGQGYLYDYSANGAYVVSNNQSMPIIWIGGTPASGGPGPLATRTSNDPLWRWFNSVGTDVRQCYDCLTTETAVSSLFAFGNAMAYSGGTGYANATPFTLSGGGPFCAGSGILTASSGVPNGITFSFGGNAVTAPSGLGTGCKPASFTATGSGTNLTVSAVAYGVITVGDTLIGTGVPTGTTIVSQTSGTTGGVGVYVTSVATTASAATITRTPTVNLIGATGTGVTITATPSPCGQWTVNLGVNAAFSTTTCANQYVTFGSFNTNQSPVSGEVMTWLINSLVDPVATGRPRSFR